jgi:hypothetical protein
MTMNAQQFVSKLQELAPAKSVLIGCDYGDEEANDYIESFKCRPRDQLLGIETYGDSMLELVNGWDLSRVEIGPISFHTQPKQFENYLEVGRVEGDRLAFRPDTKDYVLVDSQNLNHVMCEASEDGGAMLDGLAEVAGYYAKTAIEEIDIDDENIGAKFKSICVTAFGGSKYEAFCTSILGL